MKLFALYNLIQQQDPDLTDPEVAEYCSQADEIQTDKPFNYGFMSLKWAMSQIEKIDPRRVKTIFRLILLEHKARQKSIEDLQYRILKYVAVAEYRVKIKENTSYRIAMEDLPHFQAGDYNIVVNTTGYNLTSRIMHETNADAILFIEPDAQKAGLQIRINSPMSRLEGFKQYFLLQLSGIEPGWCFVGDQKNLIINHGAANKTPSSIDIETLTDIIQKYFS